MDVARAEYKDMLPRSRSVPPIEVSAKRHVSKHNFPIAIFKK